MKIRRPVRQRGRGVCCKARGGFYAARNFEPQGSDRGRAQTGRSEASTTYTSMTSTGRYATSSSIRARGFPAGGSSSRRCPSAPQRGRRSAERGPQQGADRASAELGHRQAGVSPARDRVLAALRLSLLLGRAGPLGSGLGSASSVAPVPRPDPVEEEVLARERESADDHLHSAREVTGYYVQAADEDVGHVEDFLVDDRTWAIRYIVVDTRNWLPGRKVVISPGWIKTVSWDDSRVYGRPAPERGGDRAGVRSERAAGARR